MRNKWAFTLVSILAVLSLILAGCAAPASNGTGTTSVTGAATGKIEVRVTDAPAKEEITNIYVTVDSVQIHSDNVTATSTFSTEAMAETDETGDNGGWITLEKKSTDLIDADGRFDLLAVAGLEELFATGDLKPGIYTQIRMSVSKVEVYFKGSEDPVIAKLPSGKLKFVNAFEIAAGETTVLLFDFDAAKSVNVTGNGNIIFKPVIKMMVTEKPGDLQITTPVFPDGEVGVNYAAAVTAEGGKAPYSWSITSDPALDAEDLGIDADGQITASFADSGDFAVTVEVQDSSKTPRTASAKFNIEIAEENALQISNTYLDDGVKGSAYSASLAAIGEYGTLAWSLPDNSLPDGLTLDTVTGEIAGTPTEAGDFGFTVTVTDGAKTDTQDLSIHIAES